MSLTTVCPHCGRHGKYEPNQKPSIDPTNGRDLGYRLTCVEPDCQQPFFFPLNSRPGGWVPQPKAAPAPKPKAPPARAETAPPVEVSKPKGWSAPVPSARPAPPVPAPAPAPLPERGHPVSHGQRKAAAPAGWGKPPQPAPAPAPVPTAPPAQAAPASAPVPLASTPAASVAGEKKKNDIPAWALIPILAAVALLIIAFMPSKESGDVKEKTGPKVQEKAPEPPAPQPKPPEKAPELGIDPGSVPDPKLPPPQP